MYFCIHNWLSFPTWLLSFFTTNSSASIKRFGLIASLALCSYANTTSAEVTKINHSSDWQDTLTQAEGQTVYFNAWGGSQVINDYIRWAAEQVKERFEITVNHVKVTDAGEVVSKILAEKSAGRGENGSVDLVWINGENFRSMKENGLLAPAYTQDLPNYALIDTLNKPSTLYDFTTPVDNLELPWGMAQLVFMYDTKHLKVPPDSMLSLLDTLVNIKGRFSYPALPNFHGTSFVKQALIELIEDSSLLSKPVIEADFVAVTAPLWRYLDKLHPLMWRAGRSFPKNSGQMKSLLNDGELFISLTFNPNDASNAIANNELPESVKTYVHRAGSLGNTHFVAIPFNATAKAGAKVFGNFLISPQAQLRKATPNIWGDPTVLALHKLSKTARDAFDQLPLGPATLNTQALGKILLEPHSSWVDALENAWLKRYAN